MVSACPFCKIFTGEIEARKIYEDENTVAILDITPRFAQGQCVVTHKKHVEQFYELEDDEIAELFKTAKVVANKLKKAFNPQFVCLFSRGQLIPHAHVIVFPSSPLGVLDGVFNSLLTSHQLTKESTDSKLDEVAEKIREA
ncbi:MAG: HIT family protein [Chloroflexi bacterium]|nr:HIT family protein [Chloroflexota bacterium]